jgi:hypothetical protein
MGSEKDVKARTAAAQQQRDKTSAAKPVCPELCGGTARKRQDSGRGEVVTTHTTRPQVLFLLRVEVASGAKLGHVMLLLHAMPGPPLTRPAPIDYQHTLSPLPDHLEDRVRTRPHPDFFAAPAIPLT